MKALCTLLASLPIIYSTGNAQVTEQKVLFVNVNGGYNADADNLFQTLLLAGADATYVNLAQDGDAGAAIDENEFDQIWVFDLSSGEDNYPTDWAAIANWFNANPGLDIICDARMLSSYWYGRFDSEGRMLTENYYSNLKQRGGGLLLGTDDDIFGWSNHGINSINEQIGIDSFFRQFSIGSNTGRYTESIDDRSERPRRRIDG